MHHVETTKVMHDSVHPEVKDVVKVIIPDDQPSPSPVSPTNFFIIIFFSTNTLNSTLLMLYTTPSNLSFPHRSTSEAKGQAEG